MLTESGMTRTLVRDAEREMDLRKSRQARAVLSRKSEIKALTIKED